MYQTFSKNFQKCRKAAGLTQKQAAKALGIKSSLVGAIEEGRSLPRYELLFKMCDFFGIKNIRSFLTSDEYEPGKDLISIKSNPSEFERKFQQLSKKEKAIIQLILDIDWNTGPKH